MQSLELVQRRAVDELVAARADIAWGLREDGEVFLAVPLIEVGDGGGWGFEGG